MATTSLGRLVVLVAVLLVPVTAVAQEAVVSGTVTDTTGAVQHPMTNPSPGVFTCDQPITLHPVLQEERFLSGAQRHRATFNGSGNCPSDSRRAGCTSLPTTAR